MSIFDGMAGALNAVFGAPVTLLPPIGGSITVQGIFREMATEVDMGDGRPQVIVVPTLKVQATAAPGIMVGWKVAPASLAPRQFQILRIEPSTSPAADRFLHCVCEET